MARGSEKIAVARRAGATEVLEADADWKPDMQARTNSRGADVVFDPVGGDRFDQSLSILAPEGRLLIVGFAEGRIPQTAANRLLLKNVAAVGAA